MKEVWFIRHGNTVIIKTKFDEGQWKIIEK